MARVRRVRTPEGSRFFDLPVGAVIPPELLRRAKARGVRLPDIGGRRPRPKRDGDDREPVRLPRGHGRKDRADDRNRDRDELRSARSKLDRERNARRKRRVETTESDEKAVEAESKRLAAQRERKKRSKDRGPTAVDRGRIMFARVEKWRERASRLGGDLGGGVPSGGFPNIDLPGDERSSGTRMRSLDNSAPGTGAQARAAISEYVRGQTGAPSVGRTKRDEAKAWEAERALREQSGNFAKPLGGVPTPLDQAGELQAIRSTRAAPGDSKLPDEEDRSATLRRQAQDTAVVTPDETPLPEPPDIRSAPTPERAPAPTETVVLRDVGTVGARRAADLVPGERTRWDGNPRGDRIVAVRSVSPEFVEVTLSTGTTEYPVRKRRDTLVGVMTADEEASAAAARAHAPRAGEPGRAGAEGESRRPRPGADGRTPATPGTPLVERPADGTDIEVGGVRYRVVDTNPSTRGQDRVLAQPLDADGQTSGTSEPVAWRSATAVQPPTDTLGQPSTSTSNYPRKRIAVSAADVEVGDVFTDTGDEVADVVRRGNGDVSVATKSPTSGNMNPDRRVLYPAEPVEVDRIERNPNTGETLTKGQAERLRRAQQDYQTATNQLSAGIIGRLEYQQARTRFDNERNAVYGAIDTARPPLSTNTLEMPSRLHPPAASTAPIDPDTAPGARITAFDSPQAATADRARADAVADVGGPTPLDLINMKQARLSEALTRARLGVTAGDDPDEAEQITALADTVQAMRTQRMRALVDLDAPGARAYAKAQERRARAARTQDNQLGPNDSPTALAAKLEWQLTAADLATAEGREPPSRATPASIAATVQALGSGARAPRGAIEMPTVQDGIDDDSRPIAERASERTVRMADGATRGTIEARDLRPGDGVHWSAAHPEPYRVTEVLDTPQGRQVTAARSDGTTVSRVFGPGSHPLPVQGPGVAYTAPDAAQPASAERVDAAPTPEAVSRSRDSLGRPLSTNVVYQQAGRNRAQPVVVTGPTNQPGMVYAAPAPRGGQRPGTIGSPGRPVAAADLRPIGLMRVADRRDEPGYVSSDLIQTAGTTAMPSLRDIVDGNVGEGGLILAGHNLNGQYGGLELRDGYVRLVGEHVAEFGGDIYDGDTRVGDVKRRAFYADDGELVVHNDTLAFDVESARGKGFTANFAPTIEAWYNESAVNRMTIDAGSDFIDGAYIWGRAGYDWDRTRSSAYRTQLRTALREWVQRSDAETGSRIEELIGRLGSPDSEKWPHPNEIATLRGNVGGTDTDIGRQIMHGDVWYGVKWLVA